METVRTNCRLCGYLCGLIAHVDEGRIVDLEPDPTRYPYDARINRGCHRYHQNLTLLDHPARLNTPRKRVGERGSGEWEEIPWEQALDEIAERLQGLSEQYGPETLATSIGGPHSVYWPMHRFLNLFGTPNNIGIGQICWNPAIWVNTLTYGWPIENELVPGLTACAFIWGMNPAASDNSLFWRTVRDYKKAGGTLIVVDPRRTQTAKNADLWLAPKPGSDAALAMGLLHIFIDCKLYDREFVENWCEGFAELKAQVAPYTRENVAAMTGVAVRQLETAASYLNCGSAASIITGRGIDQLGDNSIQVHRALTILRAISGNVDRYGASHLAEMPDFIPEIDLELSDRFPQEQRAKQLGHGRLQLQTYAGYDRVTAETMKAGKRLPMRYMTSAHPNLVWRAMLSGEPYPVRAMVVSGSNPLHAQADSPLIYEALKSLDLLVTLDLYHTPTAMLSDYVLPIAGGLERPVLQTNAGTANIAYGGGAAIDPLYERRTDFDFWRGLGVRMGQVEDWPWQTFTESMDATFAPVGLDWDQFCAEGLYYQPPVYQKYAQDGFATPSGKVELYSHILYELGHDPLPQAKPLPESTAEFPLQLITGARKQPYYASAYRQIGELRKLHPMPTVEISPETAAEFGLNRGDWLWVETATGRARFQVKLAEMRAGVVSVEYGWWFPEAAPCEPELGRMWESNANVLTSADFEACDPLLGQWQFNGLPCRIYSAAAPSFEQLGAYKMASTKKCGYG